MKGLRTLRNEVNIQFDHKQTDRGTDIRTTEMLFRS